MQARRRSDPTPRHSVRLAATVRLDSERAALVVASAHHTDSQER